MSIFISRLYFMLYDICWYYNIQYLVTKAIDLYILILLSVRLGCLLLSFFFFVRLFVRSFLPSFLPFFLPSFLPCKMQSTIDVSVTFTMHAVEYHRNSYSCGVHIYTKIRCLLKSDSLEAECSRLSHALSVSVEAWWVRLCAESNRSKGVCYHGRRSCGTLKSGKSCKVPDVMTLYVYFGDQQARVDG